jgi:hypothetical protein
MLNGQGDNFFIWQHFLHANPRAVMVLPSPHGDYKSGISFSDAHAAAEIYARVRILDNVDVQSPETLGNRLATNLILIAGKKANRIAEDFQSAMDGCMTFHLDDGFIYDKGDRVLVTAQFSKGTKKTIDAVTVDYGLIRYTDNPFGESTKVLQLAGIKGYGTLAAALALTRQRHIQRIETLLKEKTSDAEILYLSNKAVEILVKVGVRNGEIQHDSLTIEKIVVHDRASTWKWASEEYGQTAPINPHRLYTEVIERPTSRTSVLKLRIDDQPFKFTKSPDRMKMIHILARQAKEDYLRQSENEGWLSALELAQRLWQFRQKTGLAEIPAEIKRTLSSVIIAWARNLQRRGKLKLDRGIKFDHNYIKSKILRFNLDSKKKVVDLVYLINQDGKKSLGIQLIESAPSRGYRINIHPALIFDNKTEQAS